MSINSLGSRFQITPPPYYDLGDGRVEHVKKDSLSSRVFYAALPFIALHNPFGRAITLTSDALKTVSSFSELIDKKNSKELAKTAIASLSLAATFFMHPIGIIISIMYDFGFDLSDLIINLQSGKLDAVFFALLSISHHALYLATMLGGSLEIIALALLFNMAIEIVRSRKEFLAGKWIEGSSHLLMSLVRFSQAAPYLEKIAYKHNIQGKEAARSLKETIAKVRDKAAAFFYLSGRFLLKAHWKITDMWLETISLCKEKDSPRSQKILSLTRSAFSSLALLPFVIGGLISGQVCHFSAFLLSTTPYIHLQGSAKEKKLDKKLSFLQLNCGLTAGGFARMFVGTEIPNNERTAFFSKLIKDKNPDLVCLQEVSDLEEAYRLYGELSSDYKEFYFGMGETPFILKNNCGLFVASKEAIENPELHSFSDIKGTESMVNKCYFIFSTKAANFITTHLSPSHDDLNPTESEIQVRSEEQRRIYLAAKQRNAENHKPVFVAGDTNINYKSPEYRRSPLFNNGKDCYNNGRQIVSDENASCETEYLIRRNWHHDESAKPSRLILDYFLSFFGGRATTRKIATFDVNHPKNAYSDHAAFYTEIET